jgi:hypothetical protein
MEKVANVLNLKLMPTPELTSASNFSPTASMICYENSVASIVSVTHLSATYGNKIKW